MSSPRNLGMVRSGHDRTGSVIYSASPLREGGAAAALVVSQQRVPLAEANEPVPPDGALPVELEMCQPGRCPDERSAGAVHGVRDTDAVSPSTKPDLLRQALVTSQYGQRRRPSGQVT